MDRIVTKYLLLHLILESYFKPLSRLTHQKASSVHLQRCSVVLERFWFLVKPGFTFSVTCFWSFSDVQKIAQLFYWCYVQPISQSRGPHSVQVSFFLYLNIDNLRTLRSLTFIHLIQGLQWDCFWNDGTNWLTPFPVSPPLLRPLYISPPCSSV